MAAGDVTTLVMDLRMTTANLGRDIRSARGILAGIGSAVALAVTGFAKADQASRDLKSALEANGQEVDGNYTRMTRFAESLRAVTTLTVPAIQNLQKMAINLGVSAEQTDRVVKAGVGIGEKFFNGDAAAGVRAVSLSILGQTERMGEYIPELRRATTETQKLAILNRVAAQGFTEAKMKVGTFSGSIALLNRSLSEAGTTIGAAFAPDVQKLAGVVQGVTDRISQMTDEQKRALVAQTEMAAGVAAGTIALAGAGRTLTGIRALFGGATSLVGAFGLAIAGLGALFVNLTGKGDTWGERMADTFEKVKRWGGIAAEWVGKKFNEMYDVLMLGYFNVMQAFGGADAEQMMADYLKEVDRANATMAAEREKANAKKKADDKALADAEGKLTAEGPRKYKASITSQQAHYHEFQTEILKQAQATAQKQVDISKKADAAKAANKKASAAAENAAIQSGDEAARARAVDADRKRRGETVGVTNPARAAANVVKAKADIAKLDQQLYNVRDQLFDTPEQTESKAATRRMLEAAKRKAEKMITTQGQEDQNRPFDKDQAIENLMREHDREDQIGMSDSTRARIEAARGYVRDGKLNPELKKFVETAESTMNKQFGANVPALKDAAKKMGQAGDTIIDAFRGAQRIGVVKLP